VTPCYLVAGYEPCESEGRLRDFSTCCQNTRCHFPEDSKVRSHCLEKSNLTQCVFLNFVPPPPPWLLLPLLLTTYLWGSGGATPCILLLSFTRGEGSASSLGRSTKGIGTPVTLWTMDPKASLRRGVEFLPGIEPRSVTP
jgi:hypothetical protein